MALCKLDEERRTLRDSASIMVIDFFLREEMAAIGHGLLPS